ncbi:arginine--tRNA ligase [Clostridium sp. CAG:167]|jgi:arginyl-tRNA synthetase|nr:arginine--tRNA ligase [Clostridium sp. CAG:167]
MKKTIEWIKEKITESFVKAGYDKKYGMVSVSNRPDLCQYQCNGAMAAAKAYKKAPIQIAQEVIAPLLEDAMFSKIEAVNPGFINISVSGAFLAEQAKEMDQDEKLGVSMPEKKTIVIDYGGPNVAKPLHVGHLRSAVIGESVKRICRFMGNKVIGDVHLGDWGLQIGLIITELKKRQPELPYFDESFQGEYPEEAPFTISDLEEIYPYASGYSKEHKDYLQEAQQATARLQEGDAGYRALWQHILNVSIADLKKNYDKLSVEFDIWKKESDVQPYIPDMVEKMKKDGFAYESEGALVVDVTEEGDKKELPPCIIVKSNGATLYATTDLATIVERMKLFQPDQIIYLADKRQSLHFTQVFRVAKKTGIVEPGMQLDFIGFGTMNGKDGKPFKTRDGGVLRLQSLREMISDEVYKKIMENRDYSEEEARNIAGQVGLAALKYGDLSNQASKDYIFDVERFASFEGNTGPYILYTIVRIKSLIQKYVSQGGKMPEEVQYEAPVSESETQLYLTLGKFADAVESAYKELAPHKICQYIYELSEAFNHFYHETKILAEEDEKRRNSYLCLIRLVQKVLEQCIDLLGFEAPDKM